MSGRVRDRDVLLLMAALVVAVLAANLLSAAVPGLDALLAGAPILVLLMIGVTCFVLVGTIRRSGR